MIYIILTLYFLGFFMALRLGRNIFTLSDEKAETVPAIIACLIWPFTSAYYLLKSIFNEDAH